MLETEEVKRFHGALLDGDWSQAGASTAIAASITNSSCIYTSFIAAKLDLSSTLCIMFYVL